jgi:hypothetical protein
VTRALLGAIAILAAVALTVTTMAAGPAIPPPIPEKQWIPLRLPPDGKGLSRMDKHVTAAFCPLNNRVYFTGGDYLGTSYRQETWSLDVAERLRNPNDPAAGWRLEYPACGPKGAPQPKGPDFVGWTWDSRRNVFWMVPGEMQPHGRYGVLCPGERPDVYADDVSDEGPHLLFRHIMTFDPATRAWADYDTNINGHGSDIWYSVYDPVTDTIIRPSPGPSMGVYDIKAKRWTSYPLGSDANGRTPEIGRAHYATDYEKRRIFMIDPQNGRLHRWNMDARRLTDLGPIPKGPFRLPPGTVIADKAYAVWDSNAKVLIHYRYGGQGVFIYHPDESPPRWETGDFAMAPGSPPGLGVHWNGAAFDPVNNVMVGIGHPDYLFLFRYSGTPLPVPAPKSWHDS